MVNGVVVMGRVGANEQMQCFMTNLILTPRFKYITLLCCQVREILSINIPTISLHESHQPIQGWNPGTTIKIKILKNEIEFLAGFCW